MKNGFFALHASLLYLLLHLQYCANKNSIQHYNGMCTGRNMTCMYEVTCFQKDVIPEHYIVSSGQCMTNAEFNGNYYVPLSLIYKSFDLSEDWGTIYGNDEVRHIVTILDISGNQLYKQPDIPFPNLEKINLSHNNLSNASFYNIYDELIFLKEIDFSYNSITIMGVYESFYVFNKLTKINLSHNNILIIPDLVFTNFNDLQYLDLSNNQISNIMPNTFEGIAGLEYFNISFNNINDINASLFRFKNLIELNLSNNKISKIVKYDFGNLNELQFLDLGNNIISTVDYDVFDNLPNLKNIDLRGNYIQRINNLFSKAIQLNKINLSFNNITQVPKNLFLRKNITMFSIEGNNITGSLERGIFEGLHSITDLDLSHQSVTSIGDNSFFGLIIMTKLLLNNNFISFLAPDAFKTLNSLTILDISHNRIANLDFEKSDLLSLKSLEFSNNIVEEINVNQLFYLHRLQHLDLSENNITRLEPKSFQSLTSLDNILLSKNPLAGTLEENTFEGLFSIPLLDLSGTSLSLIKNNSFDGMTHLYDLNVSRSKIAEIQYNSFSNAENIEIIDLSHNRLENFAVNTSNLKSLKSLRLNNNIIKTLSQGFVKGLSRLNEISLSYNNLVTLHSDTFKDQRRLNFLDLSYNLDFKLDFSLIKNSYNLDTLILSGILSNVTFKYIKELPLTRLDISNSNIHNISFLSLQKVKNIQILLLSNNNITQIDFGAFLNLSSAKEIDVSYNAIKSIDPGAFKDCHRLQALNISHNYLSVLRYGIFTNLVHLKVLDVSYNHISDLETSILYDLQELSELLVDHNRISEVSAEDLIRTNIKKISIGENPLPCKSLIKLMKYTGEALQITSMRQIESLDDNHHGIGCNYNKHIPSQKIVKSDIKNNDSISDNLLFDIRDILLNISLKNIENNARTMTTYKYDSDKTSQLLLQQLNNVSLNIEKEDRSRNQYLERLLKLVAAMNSFKPEVPRTQGDSKNDITLNEVDKLKLDIENNIVIEKEKILAEIGDKLSVINDRINSLLRSTTLAPVSEHRTITKEANSSVFIETCVVLILIILVCFFLYKVYKSRCYIVNRWSNSTRRISEIENSNL